MSVIDLAETADAAARVFVAHFIQVNKMLLTDNELVQTFSGELKLISYLLLYYEITVVNMDYYLISSVDFKLWKFFLILPVQQKDFKQGVSVNIFNFFTHEFRKCTKKFMGYKLKIHIWATFLFLPLTFQVRILISRKTLKIIKNKWLRQCCILRCCTGYPSCRF